MADIGGDVGALVLYTAPEQCGVEIDIEPVGRPDRRTHVAVRERRSSRLGVRRLLPVAGGRRVHAAAPEGPRAVTIEGGTVTEVAWSVVVVSAPAGS